MTAMMTFLLHRTIGRGADYRSILTLRAAYAKNRRTMTMRILPLAAVALLALSACQQKSETVTATAPDPLADAVANKGPIELPPMMTATKTFRCKDTSLAEVEFYAGEKQATVKVDDAKTPTLLKAGKAGDPYTAEGYVLTGTAAGITLTSPGKPAQACKA